MSEEKLELFFLELSAFLFPDEVVTMPINRYRHLIQERTKLQKEIERLETFPGEYDEEKQFFPEGGIFPKSELQEIQEKYQTLQAKFDELQKKLVETEALYEQTLKEYEEINAQLREENENLRQDLEKYKIENSDLQSKNRFYREKLKNSSLGRNLPIILKSLLPNIVFLGDSLTCVADELLTGNGNPSIFEELREIHFYGKEVKGQRVYCAPGFLEKRVSKKNRLYFRRNNEGKIEVLISTKKEQKNDFEYLKKYG
ncbi:MAG: hypothetical protein NUV68_05730 [Caldiserica bacterium]|nr:hypothetical protein [Caldisericota bacterium]MDH7562826.1 hypothetical protein [Caldisericota bacterium]